MIYEDDDVITLHFKDVNVEALNSRENKAYYLALAYAEGDKTYKEVESGLNRLKYRFSQVKGRGRITILLNDTSDQGRHYKFIC